MPFNHPREAHARAIADYFAGARDATLTVHNSVGQHEELPVSVFFRGPSEFFPFERAALALCRGRVLDVGAGTGVHALYLQRRGHEVCAIDVLPEAVEIMRARGVRDARVIDVADLRGESFDTILLLMNGVGIFGTLEGLSRFFGYAPRLLAPGGQMLLDSGPATLVGDPEDAFAEMYDSGPDAYPGETWIELEYRGERGPPFRELYVDPETLSERARSAGWQAEIVHRDELGGYVARLGR